jgi:hypothetical protein
MNIKLLFILLLIFLCGASVKVYDDLNDNDLFEYFNISKEKEYINQFLIGFHYIFLTVISLKLPVVYFSICAIMLPQIILDRKAFDDSYECSIVVVFFLLALYLLFFENVLVQIYRFVFSLLNPEHIHFFIFYFIMLYLMYFFDINQFKKIEFGYKKLLIRLFLCCVLFSAIVINYLTNIVPNEWLYFFLYLIGYLFVSCIFQVILLYRKNKFSVCFKKCKQVTKEKEKDKCREKINPKKTLTNQPL